MGEGPVARLLNTYRRREQCAGAILDREKNLLCTIILLDSGILAIYPATFYPPLLRPATVCPITLQYLVT